MLFCNVIMQKGRLSHTTLCSLLMSMLEKFVDAEAVLQRILFAIGSLARSNEENASSLSQMNVLEMLNDLFAAYKDYHEGNIVVYGLFAAIAGLCEIYKEST